MSFLSYHLLRPKLAFIIFISPIFFYFPTNALSNESEKEQELVAKAMELVEDWRGDSQKLNKAEHLFKQALKMNPRSAEALTGLGRLEMSRGYISGDQFEKESLTIALQYATKALSMDSRCAKAHLLKGMILSAEGDYLGASKEAETIQTIDPSSCDPYFLRLTNYRRQAQLKEAINEGVKALSCLKTDKDKIQKRKALEGLAHSYFQLGDYENAAPYFKQVVDLTQTAWAYGNYSYVLIKKGDFDEAEKMAQKAINIMDYPMAHAYLGEIYYQKGKIYEKRGNDDEAEKYYILSIRERPTAFISIYPSYQLVDIYMKRGDCEKAAKIAQYGVKIVPHDSYMPKILSQCSQLKK
jgi:tetratricopeptide (TPR) repeat protein